MAAARVPGRVTNGARSEGGGGKPSAVTMAGSSSGSWGASHVLWAGSGLSEQNLGVEMR